jgi:hypothetical protein
VFQAKGRLIKDTCFQKGIKEVGEDRSPKNQLPMTLLSTENVTYKPGVVS